MVDKLNYIILLLVCHYRNIFMKSWSSKNLEWFWSSVNFSQIQQIRSIPSDIPILFSASKYYKRTTMDSSSFQKGFDKKETF